MRGDERERLTDVEVMALFDALFPHGVAGADVAAELAPAGDAIAEQTNLAELVGRCLWDVFSDNHEVITRDGRLADIGSFRGASAFLDAYVSRDRHGRRRGGHMRFYMGTAFMAGRSDLAPVYRLIFKRLRRKGCDWVFHFPQLFMVSLGDVDSEAERSLQAEVDAGNAEARKAALNRPPPPTISAYREVYGRYPHGWPGVEPGPALRYE
jgi:hypothetical protein